MSDKEKEDPKSPDREDKEEEDCRRSRSRSPPSRRRSRRSRSRSRSYSRSRSPPPRGRGGRSRSPSDRRHGGSYRRRSSRSPGSRSRSPSGGRHGRDRDYRDRGRGPPGPPDDSYDGRGGRGFRGGPPPFDGPRGGRGPPPYDGPRRVGPPPFRGERETHRGGRRWGEGMPGISLLVRNVGPQITTRDLQMAFGRIGNVTDAYIPKDYYSRQPKDFAFIEYATIEEAREARDEMDRFRIKGCELEVVFAQEKRKSANEMRGRDYPGDRGGGGGYGSGGSRRGGGDFERSSSFERMKQRRRDEERRRDQDKLPKSPGGEKPSGDADKKAAGATGNDGA